METEFSGIEQRLEKTEEMLGKIRTVSKKRSSCLLILR
jgi:hypothetical protein